MVSIENHLSHEVLELDRKFFKLHAPSTTLQLSPILDFEIVTPAFVKRDHLTVALKKMGIKAILQ